MWTEREEWKRVCVENLVLIIQTAYYRFSVDDIVCFQMFGIQRHSSLGEWPFNSRNLWFQFVEIGCFVWRARHHFVHCWRGQRRRHQHRRTVCMCSYALDLIENYHQTMISKNTGITYALWPLCSNKMGLESTNAAWNKKNKSLLLEYSWD